MSFTDYLAGFFGFSISSALKRFRKAVDTFDDAFDKVENFTTRANDDAVDLEPYTASYLEAHSAAIDAITDVFNEVTVAFAALDQSDKLYPSATGLYQATANLYAHAVEAYNLAAGRAMITALKGLHQVAKDEFELTLLEVRASNATGSNATALSNTAANFKKITEKNAAAAELLETTAQQAEEKAKILRMAALNAQKV